MVSNCHTSGFIGAASHPLLEKFLNWVAFNCRTSGPFDAAPS